MRAILVLANKKVLVPILLVLLVAIGAGVTLTLVKDRPVHEGDQLSDSEREALEPSHKHVHYDDGAVPVGTPDVDAYDLPTISETLMDEFYEALLALPLDDTYSDLFSWDDFDKDGDIKEEKVREIIAIAKARAR